MSAANISGKRTRGDEKSAGENVQLTSAIGRLCTVAKKGLVTCYGDSANSLPYTRRLGPNTIIQPEGYSIRYAAISQIGIARWLMSHPDDVAMLPELWPRIVDDCESITDIGDIALSLWAGLASNADRCDLFALKLLSAWQNRQNRCSAVELGWIVQACTVALSARRSLGTDLKTALNQAHTKLISLFRPAHGLFQRHDRRGLTQVIGRRIACFADQVYPILALSSYGLQFNDRQSIEYAAAAADKICHVQGSLGQWWWHYDTAAGVVCEGYPVFSVHQDAMAPMALFASDKASGRNHLEKIELGLRWIFGNNELSTNLFQPDLGLIWRDIERRDAAKAWRAAKALLCLCGWQPSQDAIDKSQIGFRINYECRSYHLGWILYAWADFDRKTKEASNWL